MVNRWVDPGGYYVNMYLRCIVILMIVSCYFGTSYGGTEQLMKLFERKDFWESYNWGTMEESELYQSTKWRSAGFTNSGNKRVLFHYVTTEKLSFFDSSLCMSVNSYDNLIASYQINPAADTTIDDYYKLVDWCDNKFGYTHTEYTNKYTLNDITNITTTSYWILGNTIIRVILENSLSQSQSWVRFVTYLHFEKKDAGWRPPDGQETGLR